MHANSVELLRDVQAVQDRMPAFFYAIEFFELVIGFQHFSTVCGLSLFISDL